MAGSAESIVRTLTERVEPLEIEFHRAYWDSQVEASEENDARRARLELELRNVKGDPDALRDVNEALQGDLHDPLVTRQLEVLRLSLTSNQMDESSRERLVDVSTRVESEFAAFRPEVDGRRLSDNEIEEILKTSDDESTRKGAWVASKEIGGRVSDAVRQLARIRNSVARDNGYADHYSMALDLQELDEGWLFAILDELESLTRGPFLEWKSELESRLKERFGCSEIYPWHLADPFFQSLPPDGHLGLDDDLEGASAESLAVATFDRWGIPLAGVMRSSDLYPRDRKSQHAFCLDVDRRGDIRILANIVPGERWIEVMLHESGHAAYDASIARDLPYLLRRPTHIFVTEAMAILSGRLVRDPGWLSDVAGRDISHDLRAVTRATALQSLLFTRWGLVMVNFERALYADPESDLDSTWWELVERFQNVAVPPDPPPGAWASKIHVAAAPVYYQNYLLGELLASQLEQTLRSEGGSLLSRSAGDMLVERMFRPGNLLRWDALVEEATGGPLSAEAHAAYLSDF